MRSVIVLGMCVLSLSLAPVRAAEIARLTKVTWEEFAPLGKEIDCIYGDYVLRNDRIVAVIAEPLPTRNANMTVKSDFTRRESPEKFQAGVVKFEAVLPLELKMDTHVIVATIGEGLQLGRVMGPDRGQLPPVAVSNPIFVDIDGQGFKPNGDLLDLPFPK